MMIYILIHLMFKFFGSKLVGLLQSLLICAVMLAPVWGQIHKTLHGLKSNLAAEQTLFSEHKVGSLDCQALDHLGAGDVSKAFEIQVDSIKPLNHINWAVVEQASCYPFLSFSARAPPKFL
jgi:hypothetical protein